MGLNRFLCFGRQQQRGAKHQPSRTTCWLEALEERLLLNADLSAVVQAVQIPQSLTPQSPTHVTVQVQNTGTTASGAINLNAYAASPGQSTPATWVGATLASPLAPGGTESAVIALTGLADRGLQPSPLLVVPTDMATVEGLTTPGSAASSPGPISGQFGQVPGQLTNVDLSLQDATGNVAAFHLDGPGVGNVSMQNGQWTIQLSGTDATSTLSVTSQNGTLLPTGGMQIAGAIGNLNLAALDLQGPMAVSGPVNGLTLGAIHGGRITASQIQLLNIIGDMSQSTVSVGFGGPGDATAWGVGAFFVGGSMHGSVVGVGSQVGNGAIGLIWIQGGFTTDNLIAAPALPQEVQIGSASVSTTALPQLTEGRTAGPPDAFRVVSSESLTAGPAMSTAEWNQILQQWQQNMITFGQQTGQALQNATDWGTQLEMTYYDAARVYYQIAQYTGDPSWLGYAQTALHIYRDTYVLANSGGVPGYWNFSTGLLIDYQQTGNPLDLQAIRELSTKMWNADGVPLSWTQSPDYSREVAYSIMSYVNGMTVGVAADPRMGDLINQALGHINQWFVSQTALYIRPFMVGLTAQALIQAYGVTGDPRIPAAIQTALDGLWNQMWVPSAHAFMYTNVDTSTIDPSSVGYNTGGTEPSPDLNLLIAPAYAWMYKQTGNIQYLNKGDQIFAGGVQQAYLGDGKHFDQNYMWSFDYVAWRSQGLNLWMS